MSLFFSFFFPPHRGPNVDSEKQELNCLYCLSITYLHWFPISGHGEVLPCVRGKRGVEMVNEVQASRRAGRRDDQFNGSLVCLGS